MIPIQQQSPPGCQAKKEGQGDAAKAQAPRRTLSVFDAVAIVLGIVIGSGIFFMPSLVAANSPDSLVLLGLWLAGGLIGLAGAFCYAELASAYPDAGGDYYFLRRAYGPEIGFLFVWGRMTVIQTGAMAAAAFIGGYYMAEMLPLGSYSSAIYAGLIVVVLTAVNLCGLSFGKWTQNLLTLAIATGLIVVAIAGLWLGVTGEGAAQAAETGETDVSAVISMIGLAMIFVLYTYGGWNEAAYLSAEIRAPQKNIALALLLGVGAVTAIYLIVNIAFLAGVGKVGMAESEAVAADLLRQAAGEPGAAFISILVVIAVLSTVNATIITGGRSNYALGRDYPEVFGAMGRWRTSSSVPTLALVVQGAISLLLIIMAPLLFEGGTVEAMVAYTAPVFWFFFFLAGMAVLVLRRWDAKRWRPFHVPLYPLTPLVFCGVCLYMFYSAIAYAGTGSLVGVAVLLAGVPLMGLAHRNQKSMNNEGLEEGNKE